MSNSLWIMILASMWCILYLVTSCRIDKLNKRINELEKKPVSGKWEEVIVVDEGNQFTAYKCSICGKKNPWMFKRCPNCYSEMIVGEAESEVEK